MVTWVNHLFALASIFGQAVLAVVALSFIFARQKMVNWPLYRYVAQRAVCLAFGLAVAATLGSLFYSEIAGFEPCKLCWLQRIFMYPQVLLLGIAWWRKDGRVWLYSLPMAIIGALLAGLHYYEQVSGSSVFPCSVVGYSVACAKVFVMRYGYITIPMMALTAFLLIIVLMLMLRQQKR